MKKILFFLPLFLVQLIGCNTNHADNRDKFSQTYISAVSRGDLMEVAVDTDKLTYKYQILDGDLKGTQDEKAEGTLTPQPEIAKGFYKTDKGITAIAIKDEVVIGAVGDEFYIGVPKNTQPVSLEKVSGHYNYVSFHPGGVGGNISDKTSFGTLLLNNDKTWVILHEKNLAKDTASHPTFKGVLKDMGNGALELLMNGTKIAHLMIRYEKSGEHFAIVDLVHQSLKGIAFADRQMPVVKEGMDGSYNVILTEQLAPTKGTLKGSELSVQEGSTELTYTISYDAPWQGMISGKSALIKNDLYFDFFAIASKRSKAVYGVLQLMNSSGPIKGDGTQAFIALKE